MSNDTPARTPAGVPAGGEFAVTARPQADVTLPDAQTLVAGIVTNMVATTVLRAFPDAAYLNLGEENTRYGPRVSAGALLAADGSVLAADLGVFTGAGRTLASGHVVTLSEQVDDLLDGFSSLSMAQRSPAVDGEHRINLTAAAALFPVDPQDEEYDQTFRPCSVCFERNMDVNACPNIKTECLDCCPCGDSH